MHKIVIVYLVEGEVVDQLLLASQFLVLICLVEHVGDLEYCCSM